MYLFFVIRPDGPIIFLCQSITTIYCGITVYHQALCQHVDNLSRFYTRSGFNVHILDPLPNPPPLWGGNCFAGSWAVNVSNQIFFIHLFPHLPIEGEEGLGVGEGHLLQNFLTTDNIDALLQLIDALTGNIVNCSLAFGEGWGEAVNSCLTIFCEVECLNLCSRKLKVCLAGSYLAFISQIETYLITLRFSQYIPSCRVSFILPQSARVRIQFSAL